MIYFLFNLKQEFSSFIIMHIICNCILDNMKDENAKESFKQLLDSKELHYSDMIHNQFHDLQTLENDICNTKMSLRENSTVTITKKKFNTVKRHFMMQYALSAALICISFAMLFALT